MFHRLLLALDDSSAGPVTLSFASGIAREQSAAVHVVFVNERLVGGRGFTFRTPTEATRVVGEAVAQLRAAGVDATGSVVVANCFDVASRIVEQASDFRADCIVVGTHARRRFGHFPHDGVRERILRLSPLPLLSAPAPLRFRHRGHTDAGTVRIASRGQRSPILR